MKKEFDVYIDKIIVCIGVSGSKAKQIREDLYSTLIEKSEATGETDPYLLMGKIEEVAEDFRENLNLKKKSTKPVVHSYFYGSNFEYMSRTRLFGLPLVHINLKHLGIAKGIISIGSVAIGVFSMGGISVGVVSIGGIAAGLISLGGIALSALLSIGGVAVAYNISVGGAAYAKLLAIGGYATADIAIGGITNGVVSIFTQSGTGDYIYARPVNEVQVVDVIKREFPNIGSFMIKLIKMIL